MKYTRYDFKRKDKNKVNVLVIFVGIILVAMISGTILSNVFIKNSINTSAENNSKNSDKRTVDNKNKESGHSPIKFIVLQNGIYSVKENAQKQHEKIKQIANPFMLEENGKFRVISGIYNEQEYGSVEKKMTENNLTNLKVTYEVSIDDQSADQLAEIIKANLEHLTKLTEPNVASIKTDSFKAWLDTLPKVEENSKYYALLEECKKYIKALPDNLTKDKAPANYIYLYDILKKIGNKIDK